MRNLIATGRGGRNVLCQPFPKVRKLVTCKSFPVLRNELVISVIAVCLLYVLWLGGGGENILLITTDRKYHTLKSRAKSNL